MRQFRNSILSLAMMLIGIFAFANETTIIIESAAAEGVMVYSRENYQGKKVNLKVGKTFTTNLKSRGIYKVRSIKVAEGYMAKFYYESTNAKGMEPKSVYRSMEKVDGKYLSKIVVAKHDGAIPPEPKVEKEKVIPSKRTVTTTEPDSRDKYFREFIKENRVSLFGMSGMRGEELKFEMGEYSEVDLEVYGITNIKSIEVPKYAIAYLYNEGGHPTAPYEIIIKGGQSRDDLPDGYTSIKIELTEGEYKPEGPVIVYPKKNLQGYGTAIRGEFDRSYLYRSLRFGIASIEIKHGWEAILLKESALRGRRSIKRRDLSKSNSLILRHTRATIPYGYKGIIIRKTGEGIYDDDEEEYYLSET